MSASAYRYQPAPDRNHALREQIVALAHRHRRYGAGMIYLKLRQAGQQVNHKRVDRLYAEAGLQVRRRKRKKVPVSDRQRPVQFELTEQTRDAVATWIAKASLSAEQYLFPSRQKESPHITTRQYARIVHRWVQAVGLDTSDYGTHTMRRTKATLIYRQTKNLRAIQLLLGHSKLESTVRYLGIEVDDALEIAEQTEI
ncbi:tyrosine recombinase XerC [mine drainage metagenome]|uniref:Tyrosine recombinase XerC n=1 Tax=mine drainage metagenome TaxID=410659 RepID=A0A1J5SCQ0_9ZZZZ